MKWDEENFAHLWFPEWEYDYTRTICPERFVALFNPTDPNWYKQYLILGVLGNYEDERYWYVFRAAYDQAEHFVIRDVGRWAMIQANPLRFGLDEFFEAMAAFAEGQLEREGVYQPTLF